jgi:hypothetical protein
LWAQMLCQNWIMAGRNQCVQTVLARRLRCLRGLLASALSHADSCTEYLSKRLDDRRSA